MLVVQFITMSLERKYIKNQPLSTHKPAENGSALIIIFVTIALFAALTYVFSSGTRSGAQQISTEQASLAASEILDYGTKVKRTVQQLQINGCKDTEISFENATVSGYVNPNAPANNSCHIFHPNGGNLSYKIPSAFLLDETYSASTPNYFYGEWSAAGRHCMEGVGTCPSSASLVLFLSALKDNVCKEINDNPSIPLSVWRMTRGSGSTDFKGVYESTVDIMNTTPLSGRLSGCVRDSVGATTNQNIFYQVLIAR